MCYNTFRNWVPNLKIKLQLIQVSNRRLVYLVYMYRYTLLLNFLRKYFLESKLNRVQSQRSCHPFGLFSITYWKIVWNAKCNKIHTYEKKSTFLWIFLENTSFKSHSTECKSHRSCRPLVLLSITYWKNSMKCQMQQTSYTHGKYVLLSPV